jgi:hypothetical protein
MAQALKYLLTKHEALSSNPSIANQTKQKHCQLAEAPF